MARYECKKYITHYFYGEKDYADEKFFKIADFHNTNSNQSDLINLDLFLFGLDSATILLSTTDTYVDGKLTYEIGIKQIVSQFLFRIKIN